MKNKFSLIFLLSGLTALSANAADNAAKELKNPKPAVKAEASTMSMIQSKRLQVT